MKKLLTLLVLCCLIFGSLSLPLTANAAPKEITLSYCQGDQSWPIYQAFFDNFEKISGIHVKVIYVPASTYDQWLTTQFAAGSEPDVIFNASTSEDWLKNGWTIDMAPYLNKVSPYTKKPWKASFSSSVLKSFMSTVSPSKALGVSSFQIGVNLFCNKDIMKTCGVSKVPANWTEMIAFAKKAKAKGYIPFSIQNSMNWNLSWLVAYMMEDLYKNKLSALDVVDKNGKVDAAEWVLGIVNGTIKASDPAIREYLRLMKDLSQYFNPGFNAASWEYEGLFNTGKAAMELNGSWYPGQHHDGNYPVNYLTGGVPYIDKKASSLGTSKPHKWSQGASPGLSITRNAQNHGVVDRAVSLLQYWTDPKTGTKILTDGLMLVPAVLGVKAPAEMKGIISTMGTESYVMACPMFTSGITTEQGQEFFKDQQLFLDGKMSIDDVINDLDASLMPAAQKSMRQHPEWGLDKFVSK